MKESLKGWEYDRQRRLERRWLVNLLVNEQVVRPLLKYLIAMEIGCREGEAGMGAEQIRERIKTGRNYMTIDDLDNTKQN